jgi:MoxR-like ATPase
MEFPGPKVHGDDPVDALARALASSGHLPDPRTSIALHLALALGKPLLVEGPPGVGKTDLAKSAALALGRPLLRLQCYEGLDESRALYEWDYARQMLTTQLLRDAVTEQAQRSGGSGEATLDRAFEVAVSSGARFFDRRFLLPRPLLAALESDEPVVLLVDEVDRSDPEFEAFLLELLSDLQVTIPELGTVHAKHVPLVVLTTNGTREMTDALRRRCLHAFVDYPPPEREIAILRRHLPQLEDQLAKRLVELVGSLRALDLRKAPSVGETIDWARALLVLGKKHLDADLVRDTLGVLLKHQEDRLEAEGRLAELVRDA